MSTSFANVAMGTPQIAAMARSTAMSPVGGSAGAVGCYIPLAIADCLFDEYSPEELESLEFTLNPAGVDNVGWARVGASPNASFLKNQIGNCEQDGDAQVGDQVGLQNGVVSSALSELVSAVEDSDTTWNPDWGPMPSRASQSAISSSDYGHTYEGPIIVFDGGDEYCEGSGGPFNQYETIVGFAWAAIYDVRTKGGASNKNIWVRLDPMGGHMEGRRGGGEVDGGVLAPAPVRLVQ